MPPRKQKKFQPPIPLLFFLTQFHLEMKKEKKTIKTCYPPILLFLSIYIFINRFSPQSVGNSFA